jgi:RNA polymerase sigma-70 factor (ECF subfamily)
VQLVNISEQERVSQGELLAEAEQIDTGTEALIRRCQEGDELAIEALVRRYQNYVYRLCCLLMRSEQDAEDMTQETFIRACRALPRFEIREGTNFEAWLYRIAVNRCRSRMRRKWYQVLPWPNPTPPLVASSEVQPDQLVLQGERRNEMIEAIDSLGERHRLVVILRYYAGFSNEEIARTLKIPSGTVRSRLHTARQRLKKLLTDKEEQQEQRIVSKRVAP